MPKKNMDKFLTGAKWLGAAVAAFWLGWPIAVRALVIFMGFDFLTGVLAAAIEKKIASDVSFRGLMKKLGMLLGVLFVHLLDGYLLPLMGMPVEELGLEKIFAIYLIVNESISITENLGRAGVPMPSAIMQVMIKIKSLSPKPGTPQELKELKGSEAPVD